MIKDMANFYFLHCLLMGNTSIIFQHIVSAKRKELVHTFWKFFHRKDVFTFNKILYVIKTSCNSSSQLTNLFTSKYFLAIGVSEKIVNNMCKIFKLIVDESTEPVTLEKDEVLEDILIRMESISHRIDDIQCSLIKNNDEKSSLDLDISEIDF